MKFSTKSGMLIFLSGALLAGCSNSNTTDEILAEKASYAIHAIKDVESHVEKAILSCESVDGNLNLQNDTITCKYGSNEITTSISEFPDFRRHKSYIDKYKKVVHEQRNFDLFIDSSAVDLSTGS